MPRSPLRARFINLKSLIVFLAFFAALLALINGFYATHQVQKNQLIAHTLESNHAYAKKLALATDNFIHSAYDQLAFSASAIASDFTDEMLLMAESKRLYTQTQSFNSVAVVSAEGRILAAAPNTLEVIGSLITTGSAQESLQAKEPFISTPYLSVAGNLLVLISYPIFDATNKYLGYVGGSIYLKTPNILNDLLGRHFHQDGSYIYVVDKNKQIIYHPEPERVGSYVLDNAVINRVTSNISGSASVTNSKGVDMLAGFSPIITANWGVVSQRPITATLASLDALMKRVAFHTIPLALFIFVFIWILAGYISRPLRQLTATAGRMDKPDAYRSLARIKTWYFEVKELKQAMSKGLGLVGLQISQLKQDAATDALTGALNRRSLQFLLDKIDVEGMPFSVLAIDIDHFKTVNDTFGHPVGDKALTELVRVISQASREQDVIARTGGEEFLLILPHTSIELAEIISERVRRRVEDMHVEQLGPITVSIGIACSDDNKTSKEVLSQADEALYQAKKLGRNRSEIYILKENL